MTAPAIIEEGLALRSKAGVKGWICTACNHTLSFLDASGGCPQCHASNIQPIKSKELAHDETEALKDKQRFKYWQPETFNSQSWESQLGQAITSEQLLELLRKWLPGTQMYPQFNKHLGKTLMAFYVPYQWKETEKAFISATESKLGVKFVCCGEKGIMPEWDVLPLDSEGKSMPQIRGWRSVLGIFYRSGMIPFIPDEGTRIAWWQIKESPLRRV